MIYKILIVLVPAFDPNNGGVQRSTYKMSSYFKSSGHNTYIYSYYNSGHAEQNVAELHFAKQPDEHKNENNNAQLSALILEIKPDIVINQMPYEHEIGHTLKSTQKRHHFLSISCLRNTLYSVKLNLDSYLQSIIPKSIQPIFNNQIGKFILLQGHRQKHKKDLKLILDCYDYFVMFGPPNIKELKYFVGNYKLNKTHLIPNSILSVLPTLPTKEKRILWLRDRKSVV